MLTFWGNWQKGIIVLLWQKLRIICLIQEYASPNTWKKHLSTIAMLTSRVNYIRNVNQVPPVRRQACKEVVTTSTFHAHLSLFSTSTWQYCSLAQPIQTLKYLSTWSPWVTITQSRSGVNLKLKSVPTQKTLLTWIGKPKIPQHILYLDYCNSEGISYVFFKPQPWAKLQLRSQPTSTMYLH